jgi:hypothetical protein
VSVESENDREWNARTEQERNQRKLRRFVRHHERGGRYEPRTIGEIQLEQVTDQYQILIVQKSFAVICT